MVDSILSYEPCEDEDYYSILGCHETSNVEQINTEFRLKAIKNHPDKNLDNQHHAGELFKKLQVARDVLTDPIKREEYDRWRRSGMAVSYNKWKELGESTRATMHWASKPKTKPMIAPETETQSSGQLPASKPAPSYVMGNIVWERHQGNDLLRKFRNYEV